MGLKLIRKNNDAQGETLASKEIRKERLWDHLPNGFKLLKYQASEFMEADLPRQLLAETGVISIHYFGQLCPKLSLHMTQTEVIK